jgi:hypothetical protein
MRQGTQSLGLHRGHEGRSRGMSALILGGLLVALVGCRSQIGYETDLRSEPDLGTGSDLRLPTDLGGGPDLGTALDLSAGPDLSAEPDLASGPDLHIEPDLAVPPDLTIEPDLTVEPDLTTPPDLTPVPDLTTPSCDDGNPCTVDRFDTSAGACVYTPAPAGTECRPAVGSCDVAETCDGSSTQCPADRFRPSGTMCRLSTAACDPTETCSGDSPLCPPDATSCASLQLWLRADVGVTTSGGQVTEWRDQSGNGRHASQSVVARQPVLVNGALNDLPVLRFTGAQSLVFPGGLRPNRFTVFVVGRNGNSGTQIGLILGPYGLVNNSQLRWQNGDQLHVVGNSGVSFLTTTIGDTRVYHSLAIRYDGTTMDVYRDGTQRNSAPFIITEYPWEVNQIGAYYEGPYLRGDVAEIFIFDSALQNSEVAAMHDYLRSKYQLP